MKLKAMLLALLLIIPLPACLCAQSELLGKADIKDMTWGGVEREWGGVQVFGKRAGLFHMNNVRMVRGSEGLYSILLRDNSPVYTGNTELLLHFDHATRTHILDRSKHYEIDGVSIFPSDDIEKHGQGSAGFLRYGNNVQIKPRSDSVFFNETPLQSFTIDFYLFPINVHDSVVVLSWYAPTVDVDQGFSGLKAFFRNGRLHWEFANVFHEIDYGLDERGEAVATPHTIVVGEIDPTPLNEWHHHSLHYDAQNGLITLRFDGRESSLYWATANRGEDGAFLEGRFSQHIGVPMTLGDHYLGYIDEFRISRGIRVYTPGEFVGNGSTAQADAMQESSSGKGFVISDVIDLKNRGSSIVSISWDGEEENGTALRVFFRTSNDYFAPDTDYLHPHTRPASDDYMRNVLRWRKTVKPRSWIPVRNGEEIMQQNRGRYVQWMAVFFGTDGLYSPVLHNITLSVEPNMPPVKPILLAAQPVAGGIELKWVRNKENDISGYYVYYGNRSGYYVGHEPQFVSALLPAGSDETEVLQNGEIGDTRTFVLQGLKNEDVYFVSITAVDDEGQESDFSRELIARPSALFSIR